MGTRLYGRADATPVVRRPARPEQRSAVIRPRPQPVLVVERPGPGHSAEALAALLDRRVPHAQVDLAVPQVLPWTWAHPHTVTQVLAATAFQLSRWCSAAPAERFPRSVIAHLAIGAAHVPIGGAADDRGTDDRGADDRARAWLADLLRVARMPGRALDVLASAAGALAVPLAPARRQESPNLLRRAVGQVAVRGRWWAAGHGPESLDWFAHQSRGLRHDPLDVLLELSSWATRTRQPRPDQQRALGDLLWGAFLADLEESFGSRRTAGRAYDAVLVLDNAATGPGRALLAELADLRTRQAAAGRDPLLVLATDGSAAAG